MVQMRVLNPCVSDFMEPPKYHHAPRLADLHGKTICELSNGFKEIDRTFPFVRQLLEERFPDMKIIPYTELPSGTHVIDMDEIGSIVAAKGCDAVIGGNAG